MPPATGNSPTTARWSSAANCGRFPIFQPLNEHVAAWEQDDTPDGQNGLPIGFILSMEGSQPILHPEQIHEWYAAGLRILGPAHYGENPYCFGTGSEGGLKADGPALLKQMDQSRHAPGCDASVRSIVLGSARSV